MGEEGGETSYLTNCLLQHISF